MVISVPITVSALPRHHFLIMPTTTVQGGRPYLLHSRGLEQLAQSSVAEEMGRKRLDSPYAGHLTDTHSETEGEGQGPLCVIPSTMICRTTKYSLILPILRKRKLRPER